MHDLQAEMQKAQGLEECLRLLPGLLDLAEASLDNPGANPCRLDQIAAYLAEIRFLLGEIEYLAGNRLNDPAVRHVADRYRELEGRVKELRNDRKRAGRITTGRS